MMTILPPISLYTHLPWCVKKCPYCDFNSHAAPHNLPEQAYVTRLLEDLKVHAVDLNTRSLQSVFLGGGTPSLFSAKALDRLLQAIYQMNIVNPLEITLEANPGTFEIAKFKDYHALGINRLSIGIQSFNSVMLKRLGRIHDADEAIKSVKIAKRAGFCEINLDLMYGLPEQTLDEALLDLKTAIGLNPTHISWYQLTLEPNTYFHRYPPSLPQDETIDAIEQAGISLLAEAGFNRYEVSAYTRNKPCVHNVNYWQYGDYLGIGAGAHSKLSFKENIIMRTMRHKHPKDYLDCTKPWNQTSEMIDPQERGFEFMMNALRLKNGVPKSFLSDRAGILPDSLQPAVSEAINLGLLENSETYWRATSLGYAHLNTTVSLFLPPTGQSITSPTNTTR